jgi:hypothetical protein
MRWASLDDAVQGVDLPHGHAFRQLEARDVPVLIGRLAAWYPDIEVGSESCHLDARFFHDEVYLAGGDAERRIFPIGFTYGEELCGYMAFEMNAAARTVAGRMGVVAREHRDAGLGAAALRILERMSRAMGAELLYYFATLRTPHQQALAAKLGFRLVGIVPAFDRDRVAPGRVLRVPEALYAKVLVGAEQLFTPPIETLLPQTRALWTAIFDDARGG